VHYFLQADEVYSARRRERELVDCVGRMKFHPTADVLQLGWRGRTMRVAKKMWVTLWASGFDWIQSTMRLVVLCVSALLCVSAVAQVEIKPFSTALPPPVPEPRDQPFRGVIQLHVDATDTIHSLFRVSETISVQTRGEMVLLYPSWETTSHGPTASAAELAGLRMQVDGHDIEWRRDTIDVHAFHLTLPAGARSLTLNFEYLSLRSSAKLRPEMVDVEWQHLLLYPAGWFARDIPVAARIELPKGLRAFTALTPLRTLDSSANLLAFAPEALDRLVDAPVYAARYTRQLDLSS
jgi:Peptidase M61 N-terminal domain